MEFTGERYIPSEEGQIKYEHLHRYALCLPLVTGRVVLDLASGEGYGSALMANVAKSVTGVDLSQETVEYARHSYYCQNLSFLVGSCEKVPLPDSSVEVVTSFETIEHHDKHEEMMQEIKRVLKPDGILIISSPNRLTYTDEPKYSNPFHIKELYFDEFSNLLRHYFKHVLFYGQRLATASFVYPLHDPQGKELVGYSGSADSLAQKTPSLRSPIYFISVCSDEPGISATSSASVYIDASDDLLKKADEEKLRLSALVEDRMVEIGRLKQGEHELKQNGIRLSEQLSESKLSFQLQAKELSTVREGYETQINREKQELAEARSGYEAQIKRLQDELANDRTGYEAQIKCLQDELASDRADYEAQIKRLQDELASNRSGYESQIKSLEDELASDRTSYKARLTENENKLSETVAALTSSRKKISDLEKAERELKASHTGELEKLEIGYKKRLEQEKNQYLAKSLEQAGLLTTAQTRLGEQGLELKTTQAQLLTVKEELSTVRTELSAARIELIAANDRAEAQLAKKDEILAWIYASRAWRVASFLRLLQQRSQSGWLRSSKRSVFQGALESPVENAEISNHLLIEGWVSSASAITLVEAFLDDFYMGTLRYGVERTDIAESHPLLQQTGCGYSQLVDVRQIPVGPRKLIVRVYDEGGRVQLYSRTVRLQVDDALKSSTTPPTNAEVHYNHNLKVADEPAAIEAADASYYRQFREVIEEFRSRTNREPAILNWDVELNLSSVFPQLAIFSPPTKNDHSNLPYLDRSVEVVMLSSTDLLAISEARRVASLAVIRVVSSDKERKGSNGWQDMNSLRSGIQLTVDWQQDASAQLSSASTSIIIPVFNNSAYTSNCLEQLLRTLPHNFGGEIIVVDDASTDDTASLLNNLVKDDRRIKVIRNERNRGFIYSCNKGAEAAVGDILVFLNNDTMPQPGWLPPLLQVLKENPKAGAVGGKLIYPDGTLQEAGGIIFTDGTGCNFGRNFKSADAPLFSFLREVDYCSGALLATPRALFSSLGGFDPYFAPAYYEDTDYCFKLREKGFHVYYQPGSVVIHFEGVSSGTSTDSGIKSYQEVNRQKFIDRWGEVLKQQPQPPAEYDFTTLHALSTRQAI